MSTYIWRGDMLESPRIFVEAEMSDFGWEHCFIAEEIMRYGTDRKSVV